MSSTNLIPVFTPEGNLAKVPAENLSEAMKPENGYKMAVSVTSPEGNPAWVPNDKAHDAIAQGFKLGPPEQQPDPAQGTAYEGYSRLGKGVGDALSGFGHLPGQVYHAFADEPTAAEGGPDAYPMNGRVALGMKRLVADPMAAERAKAAADLQQGHTSEAVGHSVAGSIPLVGPFAAHSGEAIGQDPLRGGAELGVNLLAPKVAGEALGIAKPALADASKGIRTAAADSLDASAKADLGKVLAPTKQATKFIAKEKVIPGMQERGITARSAPALQEQAASKMDSLGQQIDDAYDAQPVQPSIPTQPIIDKLEAYKKNFVNDVPALGDQPAKSVVLNPDAIDRIQAIQDKIAEHGDALDPQTMRTLRQFFDENVAAGKGYAGKTMAEGHSLEVQKQAANAIRGQLADTVPGLSDLNSEFAFWKNLNDVLEQTAQRRTGQMGGGLGRKIATGTGAAVGAAAGHAFGGGPLATETGAAIGGATANALSRIVNSTAWNTVSAKLKTGLANALASKDPAAINQAVSSIQAATSKQPVNTQSTRVPATPSGETPQSAPQAVPAFLRGTQQPVDAAAAVEPPAPRSLADVISGQKDDRTNLDYRTAVDKMTPEEQVDAIFRNKLSSLPNGRAYDMAKSQLADTHPHIGFADIDDFKDLNTKLGEHGVDKVVFPALGDLMGDALSKESGAVHAFHVHGDEFNFLGQDPEAISRVVADVNSKLQDATFKVKNPDGTIAESKVTGFSHGTGPDEASAAIAEKLDKQRRKEAGIRRGDRDKTQDTDTGARGNSSRQQNPVNDSRRQNVPQSNNPAGSNNQENPVNRPALADILKSRPSSTPSTQRSLSDILDGKKPSKKGGK